MMRFGNGMGKAMNGYFPGVVPVMMGGLCMLAIIALLVVTLILVIRMYKKICSGGHMGRSGQRSASMHSPAAVDILNERLAKGEITDEEYTAKKELLTK